MSIFGIGQIPTIGVRNTNTVTVYLGAKHSKFLIGGLIMSGGDGNSSPRDTMEDKMEGSHPEALPSKPCVCPRCGALLPHPIGTPCYNQDCPKCGRKMLSM